MTYLCQFRDIFGEPGKGVHAYRLFGVAIVDVVATVVAAKVLHVVMRNRLPHVGFWHWLVLLFIAGIVMHRLFCVRTVVDRVVFG